MIDVLTVCRNFACILTASFLLLHAFPVAAQENVNKTVQTKVEKNKDQPSKALKAPVEKKPFSIAPILCSVLAVIGVFAVICKKILSVAETYDMRLIRTKTFYILTITFVVSLILLYAGNFFDSIKTHSQLADDAIWGIALYFISLAIAYLINAKQSSFLFAIPFTLLQALAAPACIMLIIFIMHKMNKSSDRA